MRNTIVAAAFVCFSNLCIGQQTIPSSQIPSKVITSQRQAEFTPVAATGAHEVRWGKGYLVSFPVGELKEPVSVYDRNGKLTFEKWPELKDAAKIFIQDAVPTEQGRVVLAASAISRTGAMADMLVEMGSDGVHRVIRTTPFYPLKVCTTQTGTVWAFGKELTDQRTAEPNREYKVLREYSFEQGEMKAVLERSAIVPPPKVPLNGSKNDTFLKCGGDKLVLVLGATTELVEINLANHEVTRTPVTSLPPASYMTGAAVTDAGDVYVSTLRPGKDATTELLRLKPDTSVIAADAVKTSGSTPGAFLLLGDDGGSLVYSRGRRAPT